MAQKSKFKGGATRTKQKERFDLIPPAALEALARRLGLGADKHGARNWEKGGEDFRQATISHLQKHLADYMRDGNKRDGNTDAIICNAAFLCFFEESMPYSGTKGHQRRARR